MEDHRDGHAVFGTICQVDSDSPIANVLEVLVPVVTVMGLLIPIVVAVLKGRWWAGVLGVVAFVGAFVVVFGLFGIDEPPEEFQRTARFTMLNAALNVAGYGGLALMIYGVVRPARAGSWWARRRP